MYLSRNDLEGFGNRVNRAYLKLPSLQGQQIQRIEPERLAREVCGLTLEHYHLSRDGDTLGLTSYGETGVEVFDEEHGRFFYYLDGKTILVESNLTTDESQLGRYHFTVAHETAHQILKMLFPQAFSEVARRQIHYCMAYRQKGKSADWEEWQADTLASILLLPPALVFQTAFQFGLEKGIKTLNRVYFPAEYNRFSAMATQLGVSKTALAIRMKQLGLLQKEYLKDPHALVDIEKEPDEP